MIRPLPGNRGRRGGFTLIEMMVVCFMLSLLATMMAGAWSAFGKPAVNVDARCRIAQEASLAAESLARDLSGYLPNSGALPGGQASAKFVGRMEPENTALWLCFDSQASPNRTADWASPDTVIVYQLSGDQLVRSDQEAGTTVVIARYLTSFQAADQGVDESGNHIVSLQLSFSYRNIQRTYNLIGVDPSPLE
jgi:prepilin-type N-terminal cleavage/methylation domain-containing protein